MNQTDVQYGSMEMQDQFAHTLIGNSGTFLDIGSADPLIGNNTVRLEQLGWTGLAFDAIDSLAHAMNVSGRKTICYSVDVTQPEPFVSILLRSNPSKHFNYISLDVDSASVACLQLLVDNGFTFDVMTFEHDAYLEGEARRAPSRQILLAAGYRLLFEDVMTCSKNWSHIGPQCHPRCNHPPAEQWVWEDWWIGPSLFKYLGCANSSKTHQECVELLQTHIGSMK